MILTPEEAGKIRVALEDAKALLLKYCISFRCVEENIDPALAILSKPEPRAMRSAEQDNKHHSTRMSEAASGLLQLVAKHKSVTSDAAIKDVVDFCRIVYRNGLNDGLQDALASRPDVAGFKLVPIKQTQAMMNAFGSPLAYWQDGFNKCYERMLAAAPSGKGETP